MTAILFGSLSTVADTSELQRQAFNQAFSASGLDWNWGRDVYLSMLQESGGQSRISTFAATRNQVVDAAAIHQAKSECFWELLAASDILPRPGVAETIEAARLQGLKVAWVTTTSASNISALLDVLQPELKRSDFDLILDSSCAGHPKPDGEVYQVALERLEESAGNCVAIEDNLDGVLSAQAAGLACVAFPNLNTAEHRFETAQMTVSELKLQDLSELISN